MTEFSDDLREYYFSNPADQVAYDTLEFRHPAFVNEHGHPVALRVVNESQGHDFVGTLEATAPMNPGATVTFTAVRFGVTLPESNGPGLPSCQIEVSNVGRVLLEQIEQATSTPAPVQLTYRQFLSDDTSEPGVVFDGLTLRKITANILRITATAGFEDDLNTPFPRKRYTPEEYPGLVR